MIWQAWGRRYHCTRNRAGVDNPSGSLYAGSPVEEPVWGRLVGPVVAVNTGRGQWDLVPSNPRWRVGGRCIQQWPSRSQYRVRWVPPPPLRMDRYNYP